LTKSAGLDVLLLLLGEGLEAVDVGRAWDDGNGIK
jgi:hypothetical protein